MRQMQSKDCIRDDGHGFDRRGRLNADWRQFHQTHIDAWTNRLDEIEEAELFREKISPISTDYSIEYVSHLYPDAGVSTIICHSETNVGNTGTFIFDLPIGKEENNQRLIELIEPTLQVVRHDLRE